MQTLTQTFMYILLMLIFFIGGGAMAQEKLVGLSPAEALEYMKATPDIVIVEVNTDYYKIKMVSRVHCISRIQRLQSDIMRFQRIALSFCIVVQVKFQFQPTRHFCKRDLIFRSFPISRVYPRYKPIMNGQSKNRKNNGIAKRRKNEIYHFK